MLVRMHRVPLVSVIAACIVVGHVVPHFLAEHAPAAPPPVTLQSLLADPADAAPLVAPTCRLQPPLSASEREPMRAALRQLIARDEQRYPRLTARHHDLVRCLEL
jgi:hypothetical protein